MGRRTYSDDESVEVDFLGIINEDATICVIKLRRCALDEAEVVLGVLLKELADVDKELVLVEHVI